MADELPPTTAEEWRRMAQCPIAGDILRRDGFTIRVASIAHVPGEEPLDARAVVLFQRGVSREWLPLGEWQKWLGAVSGSEAPQLLPLEKTDDGL